jgi:hypothetical protein
MYPNGTVLVDKGIFTPGNWVNQWADPPAECQLGISMQFSSFRGIDTSALEICYKYGRFFPGLYSNSLYTIHFF